MKTSQASPKRQVSFNRLACPTIHEIHNICFRLCAVAGHAGELVFGKLGGAEVVCMKGRFHSYEGHPMSKIAMPIRVFKEMGVEIMFVTNAAGGLNPNFKVADVMIMSDHLFLPGMAGKNPLVGENDADYGPRFVPMTDPYDPSLSKLAWETARQLELLEKGFIHRDGTYAMVSGPNYETPAECRYLLAGGADAVGMSTAPEVVVARHCGIRCLGFTLVSNVCVMSVNGGPPPNHAEVLEATQVRAVQMEKLVAAIIANLPREVEIVSNAPADPVKGGGTPAWLTGAYAVGALAAAAIIFRGTQQ
jgi:purine-nucleoside phosphorylase